MEWSPEIRPVELLSARVFRLRIHLGYSVYELVEDSGVFVGTLKRLNAGKPFDKRELPALAAALRVPLCELLVVIIGAPNEPAFQRRRSRFRRKRP